MSKLTTKYSKRVNFIVCELLRDYMNGMYIYIYIFGREDLVTERIDNPKGICSKGAQR